jgi:hypothetical protein
VSTEEPTTTEPTISDESLCFQVPIERWLVRRLEDEWSVGLLKNGCLIVLEEGDDGKWFGVEVHRNFRAQPTNAATRR